MHFFARSYFSVPGTGYEISTSLLWGTMFLSNLSAFGSPCRNKYLDTIYRLQISLCLPQNNWFPIYMEAESTVKTAQVHRDARGSLLQLHFMVSSSENKNSFSHSNNWLRSNLLTSCFLPQNSCILFLVAEYIQHINALLCRPRHQAHHHSCEPVLATHRIPHILKHSVGL